MKQWLKPEQDPNNAVRLQASGHARQLWSRCCYSVYSIFINIIF